MFCLKNERKGFRCWLPVNNCRGQNWERLNINILIRFEYKYLMDLRSIAHNLIIAKIEVQVDRTKIEIELFNQFKLKITTNHTRHGLFFLAADNFDSGNL